MTTPSVVTTWLGPPERFTLGVDEVHVWRAALGQPPTSVSRMEALLSTEERARARQCFVAAHGALRDILSRYLPNYASEQLRHAALFPAPTSEILTVSPHERTGFELSAWPIGRARSTTPRCCCVRRLARPLIRCSGLRTGQRKVDSGEMFAARGPTLMLWNIDSQDWNPKIAAGEVGDRVLSLMLLWRRGIVLLHDVHDKAPAGVPYLIERTRNAGVGWVECHRCPA